MKSSIWLLPLCLVALACTANVDPEGVDSAEDELKAASLSPSPAKKANKKKAKKKKAKKNKPIAGPTCATIKCAAGTHCVDTKQGGQCVPDLTCDNVLCLPGHTCEEDCDGAPVCIPSVCEGFAGFACPEDFSCIKKSKAPDVGGTCVRDCAASCGECVSNNDCEQGQKCTAATECLTSCSCPMCDVCAGQCVPAN